MKVIISKDALAKGLQKVSSIVGSRSTLPILGDVLLNASENKLTLTTSNIEIRIEAVIDATIEQEGVTALPVKRLVQMVSLSEADKIEIEVNDKNHAKICAGTANYILFGHSPVEFPECPKIESVRSYSFKQVDLARILEQISYSVSTDDSRKTLTGILFSVKQEMFTATTTDGKRLALFECPVENFKGEEGDVIIPFRTANELRRLMEKTGEVNIFIDSKCVKIETPQMVMFSKIIEGTYPNYRQVIPSNLEIQMNVPRQSFLRAIERVLAVGDNTTGIKLTLSEGKLELEGSSSSVGEGKDFIAVDYHGDQIPISFNANFLKDPFIHLDVDSVIFKLNNGTSPVTIESNDGFLYVIMPMKPK